jgi:hypothetical protein
MYSLFLIPDPENYTFYLLFKKYLTSDFHGFYFDIVIVFALANLVFGVVLKYALQRFTFKPMSLKIILYILGVAAIPWLLLAPYPRLKHKHASACRFAWLRIVASLPSFSSERDA